MARNISICDVEDELKKLVYSFKFRKDKGNAAMIMKIDKDKHLICLDEVLENVGIDELRESLPEHQPRFVLFSHKLVHTDGRISYPLVFIFSTPPDCKPEQAMMYAGSKIAIQKEADALKVFEIRLLEDLTEEWLEEKLGKYN